MKRGRPEESDDFSLQLQPSKPDYFAELMKLRQRWKVKKTGNTMTGDLSYKSGLIGLISTVFCLE